MKKRALSILLGLCMVMAMLPAMAATATAVEDVTFGYAYDCQRSPAYPPKGGSCKLSSFKGPVTGETSEGGAIHADSAAGSWKLVRVGAYSTITSPSVSLQKIVDALAAQYGVKDATTLIVHELINNDKAGDKHVAYGVIAGYDSTNGLAFFIGDTLPTNEKGAGYLLSTTECKADTPVFMSAGTVAKDYVHGISLSPATITFTAVQGYDPAPAATTITVKNVGNKETGALGMVLEGDNKDKFVLSASTLSSIAVGGSSTFTVQPVTGLAAGTYTATIKVGSPKGGSISIEEKANVTFTVSAAEQRPSESPVPPVVTPSVSSGSTTTIVAATVVTLPKSGDESRLALCAALMLIGAAGLAAAGIYGKKRTNAK